MSDARKQAHPYNYVFDNAWHRSRDRLKTLEAWLDPGTTRHLEALGVEPGWQCLEVGAGGGSIAVWLARRVGPAGRVLATDLDTRFLDVLDAPNLEIRRHDILVDELPEATFDLAHTRLVLAHLPDRAGALRRMVGALRPGGWLLVEEMDFISAVPDPASDAAAAELLTRALAAHHRVMAARGFDTEYGRRLASDLCAQGLVEVGAEGRLTICRGGTPMTAAWQLTFEQLRDGILADGDIDPEEFTELAPLLDDPQLTFLSQATLAAWGRRPAA